MQSLRLRTLLVLVLLAFVIAGIGFLDPQTVAAFDQWLERQKCFFVALRWSVIALLLALWGPLVRALGKFGLIHPQKILSLSAHRWRFGSWFILIELGISLRLLS